MGALLLVACSGSVESEPPDASAESERPDADPPDAALLEATASRSTSDAHASEGSVAPLPADAGDAGSACSADCDAAVLAMVESSPVAIAADDRNVYWTTQAGFAGGITGIFATSTSGGPVRTLAEPSLGFGSLPALVVASDTLYFLEDPSTISGTPNAGAVEGVPIAGGGLFTVGSSLTYPTALALCGQGLRQLVVFESGAGDAGALATVPLTAGSAVTTIEANLANATSSIAVGGDRVYWSTGAGVMSAPLSGGTPTVMTSDLGYALAADDLNVYWATGGTSSGGGGTIVQQPSSGGPPIILASNEFFPTAIAVDASNVYWTTGQPGSSAGTVSRTRIGGGGPIEVLVSNLESPGALALNTSTVFWINGDATIRSVDK